MEDLVLNDPRQMFGLPAALYGDAACMAWCAVLCPKGREQELFDAVSAQVQGCDRFTKTLLQKNAKLFLPVGLRLRFLPFYLKVHDKMPPYSHFEAEEWAAIVEHDGRYIYRVPTGLLKPGVKIELEKRKKQKVWEERKACFAFLTCLYREDCVVSKLKGIRKFKNALLQLICLFVGADMFAKRPSGFKPMPGWRKAPPLNAPNYLVGRKGALKRTFS